MVFVFSVGRSFQQDQDFFGDPLSLNALVGLSYHKLLRHGALSGLVDDGDVCSGGKFARTDAVLTGSGGSAEERLSRGIRVVRHVPHSGGYSVGVPPLPIPNREVKPNRADGTAQAGE